MVLLSTIEEWQHQSSLLLQARPATARVTTKYKIPNLDSPKYQNKLKRKRGAGSEDKDAAAAAAAAAPRIPKASLIMKTYDPHSGTVLKFKTDRSQDVGRLVAGLGRLGRHMAALPEKGEGQETAMENAAAMTTAASVTTASKDSAAAAPSESKAQQQQGASSTGGGGGKKKKKGKK